MTLPFETWQQLLFWLTGTAIVGGLVSVIQNWLKGKVDWYAKVDGRLVAICLALLATGIVYVVQFVIGIKLFPDIVDVQQFVMVTVNFILTLLWSQTAYGMVLKKDKGAGFDNKI